MRILAIFGMIGLLFAACNAPKSNTLSNSSASSANYPSELAWDGQKVEKTDAEWKQLLPAESFEVLRHQATERPFTGALLKNKEKGVYTCGGCGLVLFKSEHKFESGTGWPSFWEVAHSKNVGKIVDKSHGMERVEVVCNRCGGHLGHVFEDGPQPTGLRYCINSVSLGFKAE